MGNLAFENSSESQHLTSWNLWPSPTVRVHIKGINPLWFLKEDNGVIHMNVWYVSFPVYDFKVNELRNYNQFHNILRLLDVLQTFPFATSETMCDYYL